MHGARWRSSRLFWAAGARAPASSRVTFPVRCRLPVHPESSLQTAETSGGGTVPVNMFLSVLGSRTEVTPRTFAAEAAPTVDAIHYPVTCRIAGGSLDIMWQRSMEWMRRP